MEPDLRSTARIGSHPIHPMLVPFPIAFFVAALVTDITYWRTETLMWSHFSSWLIAAGIGTGLLAAVAGLTDFIARRAVRAQAPAWPHAIGNLVALGLAILNAFIHARDGWTAVVPWGLVLSATVVAILAFTGWMGWSMVYRYRVGVAA
ncbi:DUF2231 domain-containing protein [Methylobacterium sp. DB1607]|nr:DUF2231 domain-containing protein [Methylobacterium sp. DB1607]